MAENNGKQRLIWVDQLKAVGMFFVVWGHCMQGCKAKLIVKGIYSFHMPFFFLLSGLTLNPDKYTRTVQFLKEKAKSILYPYVIMSIVLLPLWYYNRSLGAVQNDSILKIILGIFYSNSNVIRATTNAGWFCVTLFFAEFLFYLLHKYLKNEKQWLLGSFLFALLGVMASMGEKVYHAPFHLDVAFVAQFYICIGYLLRSKLNYVLNCIQVIGKYKGVVFLLMVSLFFAIINTTVDFSNERYGNFLFTLISSLGISFGFIYIFQYIPKISLLSYIGRNTVIYLLVHVPILRTLQCYFPVIEHSRLYATMTAVILYFGILILCWLINRFFPYLIHLPKKKEESAI